MSNPGPGGGQDQGTDPETLAALSALYRVHSRWAIWPPWTPFGPWTAVRIAGSRVPSPGLPLLWATATTSVELDAEMRRADSALRPDWGAPEALPPRGALACGFAAVGQQDCALISGRRGCQRRGEGTR